LAIELSKKSWIVAVNTPLSDKVGRQTLRAADWKGLLDLIARIRTRVVEALNRPVEVISCYEAGYDGFWLHRVLEAHGVRNYVIDPASLQVDRRARRVKTDNIDLSRLLRSLMAYLRGEPKVWSVVRVPSVAEEDDRRLHRERNRLINERVQHVKRVCARSTASMTTSHFGQIDWRGWSNCVPLMGANCRHASRPRSCASCSAWNSF
jgi:transposase